ncbi:MAG: hypothetical protein ABGX05_11010, partial [Pirellulaceae bacterium]
ITLNSKVRIFVLAEANFVSAFGRSDFIYEVTEAGIQLYGPGGGGRWKIRSYDDDLEVSAAKE